jgi:hypothetical protein
VQSPQSFWRRSSVRDSPPGNPPIIHSFNITIVRIKNLKLVETPDNNGFHFISSIKSVSLSGLTKKVNEGVQRRANDLASPSPARMNHVFLSDPMLLCAPAEKSTFSKQPHPVSWYFNRQA